MIKTDPTTGQRFWPNDPEPETCPHCGYCKHCGRSNVTVYPYGGNTPIYPGPFTWSETDSIQQPADTPKITYSGNSENK